MAKIKSKTTQGTESGQAQRVGIFGASGCGKTYKARQLTAQLNRIIYFDPMSEYLKESKGFSSLKMLNSFLQTNFSNGFRVSYIPEYGEGVAELEQLCQLLIKLQYGFGRLHHSQLTLVVDELDESFPSGILQKNPKNMFGYLCKRGRHYGINLVGISQRTAQVDICFRGNCSAMYLFRHTDPIDTEKVIQMVGREYSVDFRALQNREYILKNNGLIKMCKKN